MSAERRESANSSIARGTPVLVRNSRNAKWVLRTFDCLDGSWVNETRCVTTDGENWRLWVEYAGNERLEGTGIPVRSGAAKDGGVESLWHPMDVCLYWNRMNERKIGFFWKFDVNEKNETVALVSKMPFRYFGVPYAGESPADAGGQIEAVSANGICHIEEAYPFWDGGLYSEPADPNPHGSRIVPC